MNEVSHTAPGRLIIRSVQAYAVSFPVAAAHSVQLGVGRTVKRDAVIVKVTTECGLTGFGESHHGRAHTTIAHFINTALRDIVLGQDAWNTTGIWQRVYTRQLQGMGLGAACVLAMSGLDMALWDIRGKAAGLPLYRLLGGECRPLPAYAGGVALGWQAPDALADEAQALAEAGYQAVKLRIGDTPSRDLARIRAVRERLGDEAEILTDAMMAYSLDDARRVIPALDDLRVGWLEEPFACDNFGAYRVAGGFTTRVPIAAGENHYTRFEFARLLEDGVVQVFQPDLSKTGGVTEAMRIAAMVSAWGYKVHPHSSATSINHAACLHMLAAVDNAGYFEACVSHHNPFRDMFGTAFSIDGSGHVKPSEGYGLGVDIDEAIFEQFAFIDGPGYIVKF